MRIYPRERISGIYDVPADRYAAQCAVILSSLAKGKTTIIGRTNYADVAQTVACVKKLGAKVKRRGDHLEIKGIKGLKEGTYRLECGNSATTMRLLCGVAAGSNVNAVLSGGKYLSKRNMKGVKEPLEKMGATVALTDYTVPPVWVEGAKIRNIEYESAHLGALTKAAILFAALSGGAEAKIIDGKKTDDSAEILLKEMGADIAVDGVCVTLKKSELPGGNMLYVAGDIHAANALLALGVLLGKVTVKNVCINPRKTYFLEVIKRMGADVEITNKRRLCGEIIGDVTAKKSVLRATHVTGEESEMMADDLPVLAVLMGVSKGESIIVDIDEEHSDSVSRRSQICGLIKSLGGNSEEFDGGLLIRGVERYFGGTVNTNNDHRIALAGAIALLASANGGELDDETSINASFPKFFDYIRQKDVGVIGKGDIANLSFEMQGYILDKLGVARYGLSKYNVSDDSVKKLLSEMREHAGYSVFYPYCAESLKSVYSLSSAAQELKFIDAAIGTTGYSFVGNGLTLALKFAGKDLGGKKVLLLGTGNAAKSVVCALASQKVQIDVYSGNSKFAQELAKKTKHAVGVASGDLRNEDYFAVINATPVGSGYYEDEYPAPECIIKDCKLAVEMVVSDRETRFVRLAKESGADVITGDEIAFFTAYLADCAFFDEPFFENDAFAAFYEYPGEKK